MPDSAPSASVPFVPNTARTGTRRKLLLAVATLIFVAIGALYGYHWQTVARFSVTTDDAYVSGNVVQVTPQIAGTVTGVHADDTDYVRAGQLLIDIDDTDTRLALDRAKDALAQTVREIRALIANDGALAAGVALQDTNLARLQQDLARRQRLVNTGAVSGEELKHARDAVEQATAQRDAARKQLEANHVLIDNTTIAAHPRVQDAAERVREAFVAWRRTKVLAPIAGQIARRTAQVGQRTTPGTPLMAIVPLDEVWIDANFKEAQLQQMRIGQRATVTADVYGTGVPYHGTVVGLAAGTGAAFSLLPAQNATGNWIKVVQRVPVRIGLDPAELAAHPLRIGLSMQIDVNIRDQSGPQLSVGRQRDNVAETGVFSDLDKDADDLIRRLIAASEGSAAAKAPTGAVGP
ncbi:MAG: HlyD family efflux transporter periplasmic adaptor subunit [Azospirillaceae bacterium]|nr:HlyD family efflux transporter periplasmic adaptor subunit [Azospirillaceae bacterium]